jgi:hypothetical protein
VTAALIYEDYYAANLLADRIHRWQTIAPGSLRLPAPHVPQAAVESHIHRYLLHSLAPTTTGHSDPPPRLLGLYGPPLSGKCSSLRSVIGAWVRFFVARDPAAAPLDPTVAATAATALDPAGIQPSLCAAFGAGAASPNPQARSMRFVYLPVGDNFKTARTVTAQWATILDYRPLYFTLISCLPDHLRTDSACDNTSKMFNVIEQAAASLRSQYDIATVVCIENMQCVIASQHRLMLAPQLHSAAPGVDESRSPVKPTVSAAPSPMIAANANGGFVNLSSSMQLAPQGDALVADLIQTVHAATKRGSYQFIFTSSSPITALKFHTGMGADLQMHRQPLLTDTEARLLARTQLVRTSQRLASKLKASGAQTEREQPMSGSSPLPVYRVSPGTS